VKAIAQLAKTTPHKIPALFLHCVLVNRLLGQVIQNEAHILVRDRGPHPHMADNRCHHAWRQFLWCGMERPQFACNLFSPSSRIASARALFCTAGVVALLLRGESTATHSPDINAKEMLATIILRLIAAPLVPVEP
jgi:hypothetical protein